jgi:hypothetical protein
MLMLTKGSELTAHSGGFLSASAFVSYGLQLKPGVDMTSNVKSWAPTFFTSSLSRFPGASEEPEPGRDDG